VRCGVRAGAIGLKALVDRLDEELLHIGVPSETLKPAERQASIESPLSVSSHSVCSEGGGRFTNASCDIFLTFRIVVCLSREVV